MIAEMKSKRVQQSPMEQNDKPIRTNTNKMIDYQFSSIIYANDIYKKKMNKSKQTIESHFFTSTDEFNQYIETDIKKLNWKQVPVSTKIQMCEEFVKKDDSLTDTQKIENILRIKNYIHNINTTYPFIIYDKELNKILSIEYNKIK